MIKQKIIFIAIMLFALCVQAQDEQASKKNHINLDLLLPSFGTMQVQYERTLNPRMSASLSLGYKASSGIFNLNGIRTKTIITDRFKFSGIKIMPEFRWYLQKDDMTGFYAGAYYRYQNYTDVINGKYINSENLTNKIDLDLNLVVNAIGLEVGYKLPVFKNRFFIDFVITGVGIAHYNASLANNGNLGDAFYDDLSEALSNYGVLEQLNINFDLKRNREKNATLPDFRYGIKFGYMF